MVYRRRQKATRVRIYQAGYFRFNSTTGAGTWEIVGRGNSIGSARRALEAKLKEHPAGRFTDLRYEESYYDERKEE